MVLMTVIRQNDEIGDVIATEAIDGKEYQKVILADQTGAPLGEVINPVAVAVTNLPETQPVSGSVAVTNLPALQQVSDTKPATVSGTLESIGNAVSATLGNAQSVTFSTSGTYVGLALIFEVSMDNVKWYSALAQRADALAARASTLNASALNIIWFAHVGGFAYFRVRATGITSGSAPMETLSLQCWTPTLSQTAKMGNFRMLPRMATLNYLVLIRFRLISNYPVGKAAPLWSRLKFWKIYKLKGD